MNIIKYFGFWLLWVGTNILARCIFAILTVFWLFGGWSLFLPSILAVPIFVTPYTVLAFFEYFIIKRRVKISLFHWILATLFGAIVSFLISIIYSQDSYSGYSSYGIRIGFIISFLVIFYDQLGQGFYLMSLKLFSNIGKIIWLAGTVISILVASYFQMEALVLITFQCVVNGILLLILLELKTNPTTKNPTTKK